jgi:hypothetical protein
MAFVASSLGAMGDTNARSAYTCPLSDTPENNALVLVSVLAADAAGTAVEPTGVVGANLTFSIVTSSVSFDTIASVAKNLSVWRAMGSGLVNSVVTATFSNAATGCCITVDEITGVPSGSNGANAVGQSATSRSEAISAVTVIGPSALSTANGWLVAYGVDNSGAGDAPDASLNYQHLSRATHETPVTALESAWTALSGGNTVGIRGAGAQNRGAIIVELVGESGGGGGGGQHKHVAPPATEARTDPVRCHRARRQATRALEAAIRERGLYQPGLDHEPEHVRGHRDPGQCHHQYRIRLDLDPHVDQRGHVDRDDRLADGTYGIVPGRARGGKGAGDG